MPLNGKCWECENGDWYCPEENGDHGDPCPSGGGFDGFEEIGTAWLPIDEFRDHGFTIWVRVKCKDSGKHSVDLYLERVLREKPRPRDSLPKYKFVKWERELSPMRARKKK